MTAHTAITLRNRACKSERIASIVVRVCMDFSWINSATEHHIVALAK